MSRVATSDRSIIRQGKSATMPTIMFAIFFVAVSTFSAYARNLAECSASNGYSLVLGTGLTKNSKGVDTWQKDAISQGKMSLTVTADNSYDLLFVDSFNAIRSVTAEGAKVTQLRQTTSTIMILVLYGGSVETYTFVKRDDGRNEVLWTATRDSPLMQGVKAMRANCSFIDISAR